MGAIFGVKNQPLFGQAVAFYRWINAVLCACKKPCLIVNMDEASLTYELTGIVGTVLKSRPSMGWEPGQRVRLGDRRGNVTYIASISNDEEGKQNPPANLARKFPSLVEKASEGC